MADVGTVIIISNLRDTCSLCVCMFDGEQDNSKKNVAESP